MNIALLGGHGQLGRQFTRTAEAAGHSVIRPTSTELDIRNAQALTAWVENTSADAWINAAAYTAVDAAEDEPAAAEAINAAGARHLADALAARNTGAPLVYLSTDYVFAGDKGGAYDELDRPDPRSVYGKTKLAGEHASLRYSQATVLRISWVFGRDGHNFVKSIVRAARHFDRERNATGDAQALRVVDDQLGAPCGTPSISRTLLQLIEARLPSGIYHFANTPHTSWHGFAVAIVEEALAAGLLKQRIEVLPQPTSALNQKAPRPRDGRLNPEKLMTALNAEATPWRNDLSEMLSDLARLPPEELSG